MSRTNVENGGERQSVTDVDVTADEIRIGDQTFNLSGVKDAELYRPDATLPFVGRILGIGGIFILALVSFADASGELYMGGSERRGFIGFMIGTIALTVASNYFYFKSKAELWLYRAEGEPVRLPTDEWVTDEVVAFCKRVKARIPVTA